MTVNPMIVTGFVELAKLALQTYFQYMRVAGKSDEEIEALYTAEKSAFLARSPANLPDVEE
jgi:hypothetical protein